MDPLGEALGVIGRLGDISATGLLVVVVVMILTGRIVPRSVLMFWMKAYEESQKAHAVKDRTISNMADANSVAARVLDSLPTPEGGDPDVEVDTAEVRRRRRQG